MQILDSRIGSLEVPLMTTSWRTLEEVPTYDTLEHFRVEGGATFREAARVPLGSGVATVWTLDGCLVAEALLAFLLFRIALLKLWVSEGFIFENEEKYI